MYRWDFIIICSAIIQGSRLTQAFLSMCGKGGFLFSLAKVWSQRLPPPYVGVRPYSLTRRDGLVAKISMAGNLL